MDRLLHSAEMTGERFHTLRALRCGIAAIATLAMVAVQTLAYAQGGLTPDERRQAIADETAAFARGIRNSVAPATVVDGTIVFGLEGRVADVPLSTFFTDADSSGADAGVAQFGSDTGVLEAAGARIDALEQGRGPESRAWETWKAISARTPPALTYSDVFSVSEDVLDNIETYGQCTINDTFEPFPRSVTTYEERTCNRRSSEFEACTVDHVLEVVREDHAINFTVPGLIDSLEVDLTSGMAQAEIVSYDRVCRQVSDGDTSFERCGPGERRTTETISFAAFDSTQICGPVPTSVAGHFTRNALEEPTPLQCSGDALGFRLDPADPVGMSCDPPRCRLPLSEGGTCPAWALEEPVCRVSGGIGAPVSSGTPYACELQNAGGEDGLEVNSCAAQAVTSTLAFRFDIRTIIEDYWTPPSCSEAIDEARTGSCGANLAVTPGSDTPECYDTSVGQVCPTSPIYALINPPPFDPGEAEVSRSARQVRLSAPQCEVETAESCWVDINGITQCAILSSADPLNNACAPLLEDPACTYADTAILFDTDEPGHFDLYEDRFLCAEETGVVDQRLVRQAVCSGGLPGMGGLVSEPREVSGSFGKASAYLSAARMIAMDTGCEDERDPATCEIFKGTPASCKVAVFGIQNCCESPGGIGLGDYLALILAVGEVDSAVRGLDQGNALRSSYEALVDPVTLPFEEAWSAVSESFANNVNSIFGTTVIDTTEAVSSGLITSVQQSLMRQAAEWTAEIFGDAAANALFEVTRTGASEATAAVVDGLVQEGVIQLTQTLASVLSIVSLAYTIYSVAKLLIQIIWACEEEELALAVQRDLKSAHYVGPYCSQKVLFACLEKRRAYCTFSSPLSRIVQQQARPQLGLDWGSPEAPQCAGLTLQEFARIDWEEIDLSEWEAIILTEGVIPDPSEFSVETLTGQGHTLADPVQTATGAARQDVIERMFERTESLDFEATSERAGQSLRAGGQP